VADHLVALATGPARAHVPDLAGPETHSLSDLSRQLMQALGRRGLVIPIRLPGRTGTLIGRGALLPTGPGPRGQQTFSQWLAEYAPRAATPGGFPPAAPADRPEATADSPPPAN
jgi:uncharacterized protein YbjT (DUF2867 family)